MTKNEDTTKMVVGEATEAITTGETTEVAEVVEDTTTIEEAIETTTTTDIKANIDKEKESKKKVKKFIKKLKERKNKGLKSLEVKEEEVTIVEGRTEAEGTTTGTMEVREMKMEMLSTVISMPTTITENSTRNTKTMKSQMDRLLIRRN
jgi:hypothetical protein